MKIAVLPGDGIGTEIMAEAVKVLRVLDLPLVLETAPVGGAAYEAHGHPLPEATLALAQAADAVLFGAVGDWKYDKLERALRPEQGILGIRKALGLFANLRPALLYPELAAASTLKPDVVAGLGRDDRPRADRRHLLRPAARHTHPRQRRARGLRHHALFGVRDPARGPCRLPGGAQGPYCDFSGKRSEVHNHLAENHGDTLGVRVDEFTKPTFYVITCPVCGASYEQVTKKARRDPSFVSEYEYEIRLVVFDLLLYHLQGEHNLPSVEGQLGE